MKDDGSKASQTGKSTRRKSIRATFTLSPKKTRTSLVKSTSSPPTERAEKDSMAFPQESLVTISELTDSKEISNSHSSDTEGASDTSGGVSQENGVELSHRDDGDVSSTGVETHTWSNGLEPQHNLKNIPSDGGPGSRSYTKTIEVSMKPRRTSKRLSDLSQQKAYTIDAESGTKRSKLEDQPSSDQCSLTKAGNQQDGDGTTIVLEENLPQSSHLSIVQGKTPSVVDDRPENIKESLGAIEDAGALLLSSATFAEDNARTLEESTAEAISPDNQATNEGKRMRLSSRVSDDTNMLKDFISRAQAKKAARALEDTATTFLLTSPRRSPRKVLGNLNKNSPSPTKVVNFADRLDTPPSKVRLNLGADEDDSSDATSSPEPQRRSARTRALAPTKAPKGTACLIPVRRPDGSEPIKLQRSVAQELVTMTRTNTRRNRGLAKMPKYALKTLTDTDGKEESASRKRENREGKSVAWDERLVYYQESIEGEAKTSEKPKVRRLKGLGATNGTPAPKRTTMHDKAKGTARSTPKKRAKT